MKTYPGCQRPFMRGFRVRSSLISDPRLFSRLHRSFLRPSAEHMSACGRHPAKALRRTREKTSGTQGSENYKKPYFICFHYQFSCLGNEQSLFSLRPSSETRQTQMITCVTKGARRERREALYAHARVHPLEKNRDCTQYISC